MTSPAVERSDPEIMTPDLRHCDYAKVNIRLNYDTFGKPTDLPMLLVMGLNGQKILWPDGFCEALALSGPFYVIRFDNRDVGLSTHCDHQGVPSFMTLVCKGVCCCCCGGPERYRLEDMALDAFSLLDFLKVPKAYVCGASMGGMIAQVMALMQPERVIGLISIMSSTGGPGLPGPPMKAWSALARKPKSDSVKDLVAWNIALVKNVPIPYPIND